MSVVALFPEALTLGAPGQAPWPDGTDSPGRSGAKEVSQGIPPTPAPRDLSLLGCCHFADDVTFGGRHAEPLLPWGRGKGLCRTLGLSSGGRGERSRA